MNTSKLLLMVITVVLTSCYFFPFVLEALPIYNPQNEAFRLSRTNRIIS